jgi:signal transduction histidine kinase
VTAKANGDHVVIHVRDNGVGIPPDFLPVLFEPFTQKRETLDRSEGGLGLGLSIVQGIVQAHGGTIEARSAGVGQGSEFIVRLPVVLPDTAAVVDRTEMTAETQHVAETT